MQLQVLRRVHLGLDAAYKEDKAGENKSVKPPKNLKDYLN
jgi:hypothetical protein